jgi:hypothetical protein
MTLPTNDVSAKQDDFANRELSIEELDAIAAGKVTWGEFGGAVLAGAATGGFGGAAAGAAIGGIGAGPGALFGGIGGALLGGGGYLLSHIFDAD